MKRSLRLSISKQQICYSIQLHGFSHVAHFNIILCMYGMYKSKHYITYCTRLYMYMHHSNINLVLVTSIICESTTCPLHLYNICIFISNTPHDIQYTKYIQLHFMFNYITYLTKTSCNDIENACSICDFCSSNTKDLLKQRNNWRLQNTNDNFSKSCQ